MKNPAVSASTFIYSRMLRWYPPTLRAEFGDDMIDVFTENLEAAWRRASWRGVVRAWLAVVHDMADVVLPYRTARAAPVLLAVICSIAFYVSLLTAIDPNLHCHK